MPARLVRTFIKNASDDWRGLLTSADSVFSDDEKKLGRTNNMALLNSIPGFMSSKMDDSHVNIVVITIEFEDVQGARTYMSRLTEDDPLIGPIRAMINEKRSAGLIPNYIIVSEIFAPDGTKVPVKI